MGEDSNFKGDKPHFCPTFLSHPSSHLPSFTPHLPFLLSYSMKISSLFLGVGSNAAFRWGIHLGFWLFWGVFGPMSWRARQHLFSWIPNGCVSPESNACTERRSHCYYHHGYLATSFSLGSFLFLVPTEGTIGLAASFYTICWSRFCLGSILKIICGGFYSYCTRCVLYKVW